MKLDFKMVVLIVEGVLILGWS